MKKTELAHLVASKTELTKGKAEEVVGAVFDAIIETLKSGEEVNIAGFAKFEVAETKAREARNPQTGETIQVPAGRKIKIKQLKGLKDAVK
jgi:Bacterial nucleoid DNA-binding protein